MGQAVGVAVGVMVGVNVGLSVGVRLGSVVAVADGISVGVGVDVGHSVAVTVRVGVADDRVTVAVPGIPANDPLAAADAITWLSSSSAAVGMQADKKNRRTK